MFLHKKIMFIFLSITAITIMACSPPEDSSSDDVFKTQKQAIEKAKNVESIILEQNKVIDQRIDEASH